MKEPIRLLGISSIFTLLGVLLGCLLSDNSPKHLRDQSNLLEYAKRECELHNRLSSMKRGIDVLIMEHRAANELLDTFKAAP